MGKLKSLWCHIVRVLRIRFVSVSLAFVAGFILARILPPFIMDDPFWRSFWSGPPAAGIFAVVAAAFAYAAAVHSAGVAKETAVKESARKQAEWAIDMALSDSSTRRMAGLSFIYVLMGKSGPVLDELLYRVVSEGPGAKVDDAEPMDDNSGEAGDDGES